MEFRLVHSFNSIPSPINYSKEILAMGSCFAENIGNCLLNHKFKVQVNPSGILFNPISISENLNYYLNPDKFPYVEMLFQHQDLWHSWLHHGLFSATEKRDLKIDLQKQLQEAHHHLHQADYLLITWGSAYVYELKSNQQIVANCHKVPNNQFHKRLLSVNEIISAYEKILKHLLSIKPDLKFIWSISPVKYTKDGLHENNLSKSTLFIALNQLMAHFPNQFYFPAFELVQDELRDYRFYANDMAHPSEQAIDYVWHKFITHCLDPKVMPKFQKIVELNQAMAHRPLHPETKAYDQFRLQQLLKVKELEKQLQGVSFEKEKLFFS